MKHYIDISRWDATYAGIASFPLIQMAGVDGVYMKATQGLTWEDPRCFESLARLRRQTPGLDFGFYHFWEPGDGARQAQFLARVVGGDFGTLPVALDFEPATVPANPGPSILDFLSTIDELRKRPLQAQGGPFYEPFPLAVVYTGKGYWEASFPTGTPISVGRRLWLAAYPNRKVLDASFNQWDPTHYSYQKPVLPAGWTWDQLWLWQISDKGRIPGVNCAAACAVDLDIEVNPL